jgi:hypothetical protein
MILGLFIGLYVGFGVGMWLGKRALEKLYNPIIEGYKKDVNYWFESYLQLLKWYQEMQVMYAKARLEK